MAQSRAEAIIARYRAAYATVHGDDIRIEKRGSYYFVGKWAVLGRRLAEIEIMAERLEQRAKSGEK